MNSEDAAFALRETLHKGISGISQLLDVVAEVNRWGAWSLTLKSDRHVTLGVDDPFGHSHFFDTQEPLHDSEQLELLFVESDFSNDTN